MHTVTQWQYNKLQETKVLLPSHNIVAAIVLSTFHMFRLPFPWKLSASPVQ